MKVGRNASKLVLSVAAILLSHGLLQGQPTGTIQWHRLARLCFEDFFNPELIEVGRIPVGCEIVDCCPGCPGPPDWLEWRIRVTGDPIEGALLKFDNLSPEAIRRIELVGDAKWMEGGQLRLGKGDVVLKGLPGNVKDRPPVGQLRFQPDQAWIGKQRDAADKAADEGDRPDAGAAEIVIEQMLGKIVVNEYRVRYTLRWCFPPLPQDKIDLDNNAANDSAVVFLDARRTNCVDDEVRRGTNLINLGNVLAPGNCRSEVSVFSLNDSMRLFENVGVWTNNTGDLFKANLTPDLLQAPLTVWLVRANAAATAQADVANANLLYNQNTNTNYLGVGFNPTTNNVSGNQTAVNTIGTGCANAAQIIASNFFTQNRLNVYYVNGAFTGVNCNLNRNVNFIGTTANNQSLAHEFGHAFSLDHTNTVAGFPNNNVMVGGGQNRTHFSEGQGFRVNVHCSSVLNTNGVRAGPTRNCPNTLTTPACGGGLNTHCPALATAVP